MQTETTNAATGANPVQEFHLRQVFLKNVSFDAPLLNDYPTMFLSAGGTGTVVVAAGFHSFKRVCATCGGYGRPERK